METKRGLIDIHHHILPEFYIDSLANIGIRKAAGIPFPPWSIESSIEFIENHGIEKAIVSISCPGVYFGDEDFSSDLARKCNEYSKNLTEQHSDYFGAFATLPIPNKEASLEELKYSLDELKLNGICLLSNYDGLYLGDSFFNEIYTELNKRKTVVFIHPNEPFKNKEGFKDTAAAAYEFVFDTTRTVANMLSKGIPKKFPNIKFILAHAGGTVPFIAWRLAFGSSRILKFIQNYYYDLALSATPYVFSCLKELIEPNHIVYGSDFPFLPITLIRKLRQFLTDTPLFDENSKNQIYKANAQELFSNQGSS